MASNREILEKAIRLAIDGGWKGLDELECDGFDVVYDNGELAVCLGVKGKAFFEVRSSSYLIFNHSFAKALWGEEPNHEYNKIFMGPNEDPSGEFMLLSNWQYHLQMMVVSDDPIQYLGANI